MCRMHVCQSCAIAVHFRATSSKDASEDAFFSELCIRVVGGLAFQIGSISAGYYHTCALTTAGAGVCWGAYKSVSSVDTTAPAYISGGYTFAQITAGYEYSLGLLSNGTLIAWGSNAQYALGIGSAPGAGVFYPPVLVSGGYSWSSLADTRLSKTACAFDSTNALLCWGNT